MKIAVVGAGPAGLTCAWRLKQQGHQVVVFEAENHVGGRTFAQHVRENEHIDTGAGWLATFYSACFRLFEEIGFKASLRPRRIRGAEDLLIESDQSIHAWPFGRQSIAESKLLTDQDKIKLEKYLDDLMIEHPNDLQVQLERDDKSVAEEFSNLSQSILQYVIEPLCLGPFFTSPEQMSAAMLRSWLRALDGCQFFQVDHGMDAPWIALSSKLDDVRLGDRVKLIETNENGGVWIESEKSLKSQFDAVVVAIPTPIACQIIDESLLPDIVKQTKYAPQVRLYASQRSDVDSKFGVMIVPSRDDVFSVEHFSGKHGAWGACPVDTQWALVCAYGPACDQSWFDASEKSICERLWKVAQQVRPELFGLDQADLCHLVRWKYAVPLMPAGHFKQLETFDQKLPIVFAGDWMQHACIEGAVRSGERAASMFEGKSSN